ncbi:MAG TPA: hypothetical protein VNH84_22825, partial [Candidatus Saccharimonadales bacterium]|nr:hypothetical protein [Candidatus Saccharimonadales bacterium]
MMIGSGLQALTTLGKFKPMVLGEIQAAGDTQQGSKLVGTGAVGTGNPLQGSSVALSADGNTAAVGGINDNNAIGAV